MIEWIKQLTPEFYIVIGFLILLFILIIVQIIRLSLVARRLGTQDFRLMDTIHTDKEGKDFTIPCDSVITSTGYIPTPLQTDEKHIHLVGDCEHVGNMRSVIWGAYETAMKI